jgi:hypothetical protein
MPHRRAQIARGFAVVLMNLWLPSKNLLTLGVFVWISDLNRAAA